MDALIHRSQSSFEARPGSVRSSLRNSVISLDPSPPYALSLFDDTEIMTDTTTAVTSERESAPAGTADKVSRKSENTPQVNEVKTKRDLWRYKYSIKISAPENPIHMIHVGYDNKTGQFTGLPKDWGRIIN